MMSITPSLLVLYNKFSLYDACQNIHMFVDETLLDQLVYTQRRAVRYYLIFAFVLVVLGILVIVIAISSVQSAPDIFKGLLSIGGFFVSSLSSIPIKEILNRKEKIETFKMIKDRMYELKKSKKGTNKIETKRVEELLWKVVEKTALS